MVDIISRLGAGYKLGQEIAQAPQRNRLQDLILQQQQQALQGQQQKAQQQQEGFDQQKVMRNIGVSLRAIQSLQSTPLEQRPQVLQGIIPQMEQLGMDASRLVDADLSDQGLSSYRATLQAFAQDPEGLTASMRERQSLLRDVEPFINDQGAFDESKASSKALSAARELGIITKLGTQTKDERLAQDVELAEKVASTNAMITGAVKEAEVRAKARGETFTDLSARKAALPGIESVVAKLKILADDATFTLSGKALDEIAKQFGFSTEGSTARAKMVSIVDNQVLPLLKPIFGAAFTAAEGDRLRDALLDPDSSPESRKAQLDSFLEQARRNIESGERELSQPAQQQAQPAQQQAPTSGVKFLGFE
jgi:hypothetical protein